MRTLRLARIAAEAEGLRLRRQVRRTAFRLVLALIGLTFLAAAAAFAHVAVWYALRWNAGLPPWATALVVGGGDLVIALFFVLIAVRSGPGRVEIEALEVRQRAIANATSSVALNALLVPLVRALMDALRRR